MACYGPDWKPPHYTEEERAEMRLKKMTEYIDNTLLLLNDVLGLKYEELESISGYTQEESDRITEKLCSILRNIDRDLITLVLAHPHGPFITAWWSEHKELDKQREDDTTTNKTEKIN